ncbi:lysylphosphatidylglycerol synthase transmembrane domain-containing protein [Anaerolineales bacterium]
MTKSETPRKRDFKKPAAVFIGILISAFFLVMAFRELQPEIFFASLKEVNLGLLALAAPIYVLAVVIITFRWQLLLRSIKLIPISKLFQLVTIGYMGNNVYPLRAGEALRIFLMRRNHQIPMAKTTTTIIVERMFDGLVLISFILIALLIGDVESAEINNIVITIGPVFVIGILLLFGLVFRPGLLRKLIHWVARILPDAFAAPIIRMGDDVVSGLEGLRSPWYLLGAILASFLTWGIEALVYWIVMFAFQIDLPYSVALITVGAVNLAGVLPASPGQVGVWEFFVMLVLGAVGITRETALAYAIVVHIIIWSTVTFLGFFFLMRQGLGWSAIIHTEELEPAGIVST